MKKFWEGHNPTQGMRQGMMWERNIVQHIFSNTQRAVAEESLVRFDEKLVVSGFSKITTEIIDAPVFYFAEDYHQQYLEVPNGYCGLGGTRH